MAGQSKTLRVGAITAAVVGAVAIPATALAASGYGPGVMERAGAITGMSSAMHASDMEDFHGPADRGPGGAKAEEHLAKLAASLNVSVDTLKAAMDATRAELQGQAKPATPADAKAMAEKHLTVLAGKLNVSVDTLKAALEANRPARPEGKGPGAPGGPRGEHGTELAAALGVTPDALRTAMQKAMQSTKPATPPKDEAARQAHRDALAAALATNLNLPVDKVKAALEQQAKAEKAEHRTQLQTMLSRIVASGKMTQAQADQILADFDAGKPIMDALKQFLPQGGEHRGSGGPGAHGPRGPHGPQGGAPKQGA